MSVDFPDDTVTEILLYLTSSAGFTSFPLVCKQWNKLFKNPKLGRFLFAALWDPERVEIDYSPAKEAAQPKFMPIHQRLSTTCLKLEKSAPGAPVKVVWRNSSQSQSSQCWFVPNDNVNLFQLDFGVVKQLAKSSGSGNTTVAKFPCTQYEKFRVSLENRFAMWERQKEAWLVEKKTNKIFKTQHPSIHITHDRSYDSTLMREYHTTETKKFVNDGPYDSGYVTTGDTHIIASQIFPSSETISTNRTVAWNIVMKTTKVTLAGCTPSFVVVVDHNNRENATLVLLDTKNGEKVGQCEIGALSTVANVTLARLWALSETRLLLILQRCAILLDISQPSSPAVLARVSNGDNMFGAFCVRFNMLFIETHPEKWFLCREDSSLVVYRIGSHSLRMICDRSNFPSAYCIAVDDNLDVYSTGFDTKSGFKVSLV